MTLGSRSPRFGEAPEHLGRQGTVSGSSTWSTSLGGYSRVAGLSPSPVAGPFGERMVK